MILKGIFIALLAISLILNIMKTYYERKLEVLKDSDRIATQKDVHDMHTLMTKLNSTNNNLFLVAGTAVVLIFKLNGNLRIAAMIMLVLSFFIAYAIDIVIRRREVLNKIRDLEYTIGCKRK